MPKKRKINKPYTHPRWGIKEDAKEVKEKRFIADVRGAKVNAIYLK